MPEAALFQAEGSIELLARVAHAVQLFDAIAFDHFFDLRLITHVNENNARAIRFDGSARIGDIAERFAAEGAAAVPEEDQQNGRTGNNIDQRHASLRARGFQHPRDGESVHFQFGGGPEGLGSDGRLRVHGVL